MAKTISLISLISLISCFLILSFVIPAQAEVNSEFVIQSFTAPSGFTWGSADAFSLMVGGEPKGTLPDPATGSFTAQIRFFALADNDQMPIVRMAVNWDDGAVDKPNVYEVRGWFKNRKPECNEPTDKNGGKCSPVDNKYDGCRIRFGDSPGASKIKNISLLDNPVELALKMSPYIQLESDKKLVESYITKYWDAGIQPTDSLAVAQQKMKTSKIYLESIRPPVGAGGTSITITPEQIAQKTEGDYWDNGNNIQVFTPQGIKSVAKSSTFWSAIDKGKSELRQNEPWKSVWNRIKTQFPNVPNEMIDNGLGIEWREKRAYQKWAQEKKATGGQLDFNDL